MTQTACDGRENVNEKKKTKKNNKCGLKQQVLFEKYFMWIYFGNASVTSSSWALKCYDV